MNISENDLNKKSSKYSNVWTSKVSPVNEIDMATEPSQTKFKIVGFQCFWIWWCILGVVLTSCTIGRLCESWRSYSVAISIATNSLPVSEIHFPAVTICTVNKVIPEKLVIQACRMRYNLTEMRQVLRALVDPESENNDVDENEPWRPKPGVKEALRILRLVSPKCSEIVLRCVIGGSTKPCLELFKMVLTDSGYCCSFNSGMNRSTSQFGFNDTEVIQQEREYEYLKLAIWHQYDNMQSQYGRKNYNSNTLFNDSGACQRKYTDEIITKYKLCEVLDSCRNNPQYCGLNYQASPSSHSSTASTYAPLRTRHTSKQTISYQRPKMTLYRASGSGISKGLIVLTDNLACGEIPTESYSGLKVYVHGLNEYPAVGEKGFLAEAGHEVHVGVTAQDTYSNDLESSHWKTRNCIYAYEFPLKYYRGYSQSACTNECEIDYIAEGCDCVPYYSEEAEDTKNRVCSQASMLDCVRSALDYLQVPNGNRKSFSNLGSTPYQQTGNKKSVFSFGSNGYWKACSEQCLPNCNETKYTVSVSSARFPNRMNPNKIKILREAITAGHDMLNNLDYVTESTSLLKVYFSESTAIQYQREENFDWNAYLTNIWGVVGLIFGVIFLTLLWKAFEFFAARSMNDEN